VPSGARRYFKTLTEITDFISQYIDGASHTDLRSRMKGWLRKRRA